VKQRIWELDALRGLCILSVMTFHLIYDLIEVFQVISWDYPAWFIFVRDWGGVIFLILSGICVTLGTHHLRRGILVLGAGTVVTLVTWAMTFAGFDSSMIIYFGVLHCLGTCMLLWEPLRRLPQWALALLCVIIIPLGFYFETLLVSTPWLVPLGLMFPTFATADYFPLFPHLGFFLLGALLGKWLYRNKTTLLPQVNPRYFTFLCFCGRQSLWIYLLHQPVLYGICSLIF
jgi:uncharacterized membrane protein